MTMPIAPTPAPSAPIENVVRGGLFALVVVPVGVVLWTVIWSIGFISAIVAFAIVAGGVWLYRKGSGGGVGIIGASVVSGIVLVTLLTAFWVGLVADYARAISDQTGLGVTEIVSDPVFWAFFGEDFGILLEGNLLNLGLALLFGALGAFSVLRRAFASAGTAVIQDVSAQGQPGIPAPPADYDPGAVPNDPAVDDPTPSRG